tara:strand:- start:6757 stop:7827 length:1071 start_codon:yes stop_codon:yes gene_type:complete
MPITIDTIGASIVASIVDGNFAKLEAYLREQIVDGDIKPGQITRILMKRYENGKLAAATTQSLPMIDEGVGVQQNAQAVYDLNFRHVDTNPDAKIQESQSMELLGRPGPSLYWQYQEDEIVYSGGDLNRYPANVCYSNWLSVPNTSVRVYVPEPCVARIDASAYFLACVSAVARYITNADFGGGGEAASKTEWDTNYWTHGDQIAMQWAIVADTNPVLFADEFANTNPHILNPSTGNVAQYANFKFVNTKKIHTPLWARESITGEVVLQGGRWYNFSLKFKGAGTMGYRAGGTNPLVDGIYEIDNPALANWAGGTFQEMAHVPPHECLWISSGLKVELIYGYRAIQTNTANIPNIT